MDLLSVDAVDVATIDPEVKVMVDSGAYHSVCPHSYAHGAPTETAYGNVDLVTVTGEAIEVKEIRKVQNICEDVSGGSHLMETKYLVCNVRRPIRSVADLVDSNYEVHFGKVSWMATWPKYLTCKKALSTFHIESDTPVLRTG